MFGFIVSPDYINDVQEAVADQHILFEKMGEFAADDFIQYCQAAAPLSLQTFIIDINSSTDDAIIKGIRRFRMKNNARILLLAPGREPGDATVSQLVNLGVWDIIAPSLPEVDEDDEDEDEIEVIHLTPHIVNQLKMNYGYGNAARWDNMNTQDGQQSVAKNVKQPADPEQQIIFRDRIVGTVKIAVGSTGRRTGCTHTALQLASFLNQEKFHTALVELIEPNTLAVLHTLQPSNMMDSDHFSYEGIDVYPNANIDIYDRVLSASYDYVVLDTGIVVRGSETYELSHFGREFLRADLSLLTASAAIWDIQNFGRTLDALHQWNLNHKWNIIINLTDLSTFKEFESMFSRLEKKNLRLDLFYHPFHCDITQLNEEHDFLYRQLLQAVLPKSHHHQKKKRFFLF